MTTADALAYLNSRDRRVPDSIRRAREVYYSMSLHVDGAVPAFRDLRTGQEVRPYNFYDANYQRIFDQRLFSKYPRESDATREYRKSQYRPFTKDPFQAAINFTTGALFRDSGYNIQVEDEDDNAYLWGENFDGGDFSQYLQKQFKQICVDPNGYFLVIPKESADATTTDKIEPAIWFVPSKSVVLRTDDALIFERGGITWLVTDSAYYRLIKDESGEYSYLDSTWYYGHFLGYVPAFVAGGVWNTQGFLESWLVGGLAWADEFVSAKSTAQLVDKENSHPYVIEPAIDCPDCRTTKVREVCENCHHTAYECTCVGGGYSAVTVSCTTCHGSGYLQRDPAQHLIVPPEEMQGGSDLIRIVNPDVEVNKYHKDNNNSLYKQLFESIYLRYIDQAQSGKAKEMDLEGRLNFYTTVSNDIFDRLIPSLIRAILSLRSIEVVGGEKIPKAGKFTIQKPVTFLMQSAAELLDEYDSAVKAGVPTYLTSALLERYIEKQFVNDDLLRKKSRVIMQLDDLATRTDQSIQLMGISGFIPIERIRMHYALPDMIEQLIRERGEDWFVYATIPAIMDALNFDAKLEGMKATINLPGYDVEGG